MLNRLTKVYEPFPLYAERYTKRGICYTYSLQTYGVSEPRQHAHHLCVEPFPLLLIWGEIVTLPQQMTFSFCVINCLVNCLSLPFR